MSDEEIRELLKEIDLKFQEITPLLQKAGEALVEKAKIEKGVELRYFIGRSYLALLRGEKNFDTWDEGEEWLGNSVEPLFEGLKWLYVDAPFGLADRTGSISLS